MGRELNSGNKLLATPAYCEWINRRPESDLYGVETGTPCHIAEPANGFGMAFTDRYVSVYCGKYWSGVPYRIVYGMRAAYLQQLVEAAQPD